MGRGWVGVGSRQSDGGEHDGEDRSTIRGSREELWDKRKNGKGKENNGKITAEGKEEQWKRKAKEDAVM